MQMATQGSGDCSPRHELDRLSQSSVIDAGPATQGELAGLAAIAEREIPGVNASTELVQVLRADPESIFSFRRAGKLVGGIAFLYFNSTGHDALLRDTIDLKNPDRAYLAGPHENVAAIYVWALAGYGRAVMGLGSVAAHLRSPRFAEADYYARPSSKDGRELLIALGFRPIPRFQPDLWCYQRLWHRQQGFPAFEHSIWSGIDARH
ncbi:hypothetical protein [Bradyrhizobium sp. Tv2a-2]|uniref:hypothetical protein n=1 Tax=Bradyrhizobium sp. Tv2a-2 TaxID=113395 RepID=UPI0004669A7A|nr:hypothetical protein [Bradyrhizobium sp. Tv2a-2]